MCTQPLCVHPCTPIQFYYKLLNITLYPRPITSLTIMPNTSRSIKGNDMNISYNYLSSSSDLRYLSPSINSIESSLIESISNKLGCLAGRSVSHLRSKQGKRRILQAYILSEVLITAIAVTFMFLAGIYWPAILLTLINAYILYAAIDLI
jgi:hypothetical protein